VIYTVSLPHWKSGKNYTDVFVADSASGVARQMTFTREKNETGPQWARDGRRFAFLSDREGSQQVYLMAVGGGEARKLTEAKDGVHAFAFSRDGKWLAFSAGKAEDRQLSLVDLASEDLTVTALPKHATPIRDFAFAEDGGRLFFTSPDRLDKDDVKRKEKKFDVRLADPEQAPVHLWSLDLKDKAEKRWTEGAGFTVAAFQLSKDGRWASYRALPTVRRLGDITQEEASLHLLDLSGRAVAGLCRARALRAPAQREAVGGARGRRPGEEPAGREGPERVRRQLERGLPDALLHRGRGRGPAPLRAIGGRRGADPADEADRGAGGRLQP
jgi:dipeptidyl aminopeptidase/acylaminoacyl peptidase